MKKNLLFIGATLVSAITIAQPSLNSTNSNPVIGDIFTIKAASWINEGSSGANQTWNFTSVTQSTTAASVYTVAAMSTTGTAQYPNANVEQRGSGNTAFYKTTTSALQNYGTATGTVLIKYTDPEDQMRYPFAMGDGYTDPFLANFVSSGYTWKRHGNTTLNADAYGTLQLPGGTFSNVLRVHFVQDYIDSTNIGGSMPYELSYYNDMYMWFLPNNHMAIFSTYDITTDFGNSQGSSILTSVASSVSEIAPNVKSMNFYPNPATSELINLDLNLNSNLSYQVVIIDNLGREVLNTYDNKGFEGYNFNMINVSSLANGIYSFVIKSEGQNLITKKLVIKK